MNTGHPKFADTIVRGSDEQPITRPDDAARVHWYRREVGAFHEFDVGVAQGVEIEDRESRTGGTPLGEPTHQNDGYTRRGPYRYALGPPALGPAIPAGPTERGGDERTGCSDPTGATTAGREYVAEAGQT